MRHKGIVLDSLLEDRLMLAATEDPRASSLVVQLRAEDRKLVQLQLEASGNFATPEVLQKQQVVREKIEHQIESLERTLAQTRGGLRRPRRALNVKVPDVQAYFPVGRSWSSSSNMLTNWKKVPCNPAMESFSSEDQT